MTGQSSFFFREAPFGFKDPEYVLWRVNIFLLSKTFQAGCEIFCESIGSIVHVDIIIGLGLGDRARIVPMKDGNSFQKSRLCLVGL